MSKYFQLNNPNLSNISRRPVSPNRFINLNGKIFDLTVLQNKKAHPAQNDQLILKNNIKDRNIEVNDQFSKKLYKFNGAIQNHYNTKSKNHKSSSKNIQTGQNSKLQIQKAYQQLKVRQLEYLAIIKELFIQNQTLKKLNQQLRNNHNYSNNMSQNIKQTQTAQTQTKNKSQNQSDIFTLINTSSNPINNNNNQMIANNNLMNISNSLNQKAEITNQQTNQLTNFQRQKSDDMEQSHVIQQISNQFQSEKLIYKPFIDQFWNQVQGINQHNQKRQGKNNKKQVTFVDSLYNSKQLISRQYLHDTQFNDNNDNLSYLNINKGENSQRSRQKSIGDIISTSKTLYHPTFKQLNSHQREQHISDNKNNTANKNETKSTSKQNTKIVQKQTKKINKHKLHNNSYLI